MSGDLYILFLEFIDMKVIGIFGFKKVFYKGIILDMCFNILCRFCGE